MTTFQTSLAIALSVSLSLSACSDSADVQGGTENPQDPQNPPSRAGGIAVISGDYKSTVISLIDPKSGILAKDNCIDSGAVSPILSVAISGDVVLPTKAQSDGSLVVIDRKNAALVWLDPSTCTATRQLSVATGFSSNPHDYVLVAQNKAYVPRYATNPMPSGMAGANDQGQDVLILDVAAQKITGRIDLKPYATQAGIEPRPDRALVANGKVYLVMGQLSLDRKTVGPGRVAILDPATDAVVGTIDPPGAKNCTQLDYLDASKLLFVDCQGDYNVPAMQASQSGIFVYDVSGATPVLKRTIPASATGGRALSTAFAAVSDQLGFVATYGDKSGPTPDQLWSLDLAAGGATKALDGEAAYVFGSVFGSGLLYAPDEKKVFLINSSAQNPNVNVYDVTAAGALNKVNTFLSNPNNGLRPLGLARY